MSRPINIFSQALSDSATPEQIHEALVLAKTLCEKVSYMQGCERTIEDSGLMDNYTDAARARKNLPVVKKEIAELLQEAWRWNQRGEK